MRSFHVVSRRSCLLAGLIVLIVGVSLGMTFVVRAATSSASVAPCAARFARCPHATGIPLAEPPVLVPFKRTFRLTRTVDRQGIEVHGAGLSPGLTARLVSPVGRFVSTYDRRSMSGVSTESFYLNAEFAEPGTYLLSVRTREGKRSNEIPIVVR